jgi:hypothetical protein
LCSYLVGQEDSSPDLQQELAQEVVLKYLRKLLSVKARQGHPLKLTFPKVSKVGNLTSIEGSTFGYQQTGLFDGCVFLVEKMLLLDSGFMVYLLDSGLWESLCYQINQSTTENELSPSALSAATRIIYAVISSDVERSILGDR